jgi:uncharacterized membrane protein
MARTATQRSTSGRRKSAGAAKSGTGVKNRASKNGTGAKNRATAAKNRATAAKNRATGAKNRASGAKNRASGAKNRAASSTGNGAGNARRALQAVKPKPGSAASTLAGAAAKKAFKAIARRALTAGTGAVRTAAERSAGVGMQAYDSALSRRLPIQVSVDVAVPLSFAWDEWMTFEWMTEGVHRIVEVERDGDSLFGQLAGPRSADWVADIVDERQEQSFAWRSVEGSDCAGLVTFHRLSERLTRIELDLDVLPTNPAEAFSLGLRIGRRRAEAELRRFKAHVEFINPDTYESHEAEEPVDAEYESDESEEPEEEEEEEEYESDEAEEPVDAEYESDEAEQPEDEEQ